MKSQTMMISNVEERQTDRQTGRGVRFEIVMPGEVNIVKLPDIQMAAREISRQEGGRCGSLHLYWRRTHDHLPTHRDQHQPHHLTRRPHPRSGIQTRTRPHTRSCAQVLTFLSGLSCKKSKCSDFRLCIFGVSVVYVWSPTPMYMCGLPLLCIHRTHWASVYLSLCVSFCLTYFVCVCLSIFYL